MTGQAAPIVVVGAGIGGLTASLFLARAGFSIVLIEKRTKVETEGAGLQLSPNASRILAEAGLGAALARDAGTPERVSIRREWYAREIATIPLGNAAQIRYGAPYLVIHRADLATTLLDAVRGEERISLLYGREAHDVSAGTAGARLKLRRESGGDQMIDAMAVVSAGGLWSEFADAKSPPPRFSGYEAWRTLLPAAAAPAFAQASEVGLWLAQRAHLVHYPIRRGQFVNVVAVLPGREPLEGWSRHGDSSAITRALHGWHQQARDLIAAAPSWQRWSLFDRPPRRHWGQGVTTSLGDAAHPMLPFLAQGAAMAIEDAAVLADTLAPLAPAADAKGVAAALHRYEHARRSRTARVQREARRIASRYHLGWPMSAARDIVLRASSGQRLLARYDWLYGWRRHAPR